MVTAGYNDSTGKVFESSSGLICQGCCLELVETTCVSGTVWEDEYGVGNIPRYLYVRFAALDWCDRGDSDCADGEGTFCRTLTFSEPYCDYSCFVGSGYTFFDPFHAADQGWLAAFDSNGYTAYSGIFNYLSIDDDSADEDYNLVDLIVDNAYPCPTVCWGGGTASVSLY